MDPDEKAAIQSKLNSVSSEIASAKKSKGSDSTKDSYDLDRYKNSKLFQKFMKQEGVTILQKPPVVKPPVKGPSPPPVQETSLREEQVEVEDQRYEEEEIPQKDYGRESEEYYYSPEPQNLQKSGTGSIDMELEGYSEHIPPTPSRAQLFPDPRLSSYPQTQTGMYAPQASQMYANPYFYPQNTGFMATTINPMGMSPVPPMGLPPVPPMGSMLPSLEMQLYFKQMMDMYQQANPTSRESTSKDTELIAELEAKEKEIKRLQKTVESKELDIMRLEDQLREGNMGGDDSGKVQELMQELENMQKRYEATEDELIATQRDCDKARDELAGLKSKKNPAVDEAQFQDKIIQLEYKLEGALDKAAALEKALAKEKEINLEAERRMEIARNRVAKMEEGLEDMKIELERKAEELEECKRESIQQTRKFQKELEQARFEIESLQNTNERLKSQLSRQTAPTRETYARSPEQERPVESYEPVGRRPGNRGRGREEYYPEPQQTYVDAQPPRREYQAYEEQSRPATSRPSAYESPDYEPAMSTRKGPSSGLTHFDMVKNIENKLIGLQMERDRVQIEYNKIPEHSKTISQRRRREELAQELELLNTNINSLKSKMRAMNSRG